MTILATASFGLVDLDVSFLAGGRGLNTARVVLIVVLLLVSLIVYFCARPHIHVPRRAIILLLWVLIVIPFGLHPARSLVAWLLLVAAAAVGSSGEGKPATSNVIWGLWWGAFVLTTVSLTLDLFGHLDLANGRFQGLTLEPNMAGHLAGLGVVTAILISRDKNWRILASIPLFLLAILESDTRTIWLALSIVGLTLAWARSRPRLLAVGTLVVVLVFVGSLDTRVAEVARRSDSENLSELTGRIDIWRWSVDNIAAHPIVGAGLASGPAQLNSTGFDFGLAIGSASSHSLPIEIARETGLVGLGLAALLLAEAVRNRSRTLTPLLVYLAVTALTMPMAGFAGLITVAWFAALAESGVGHPPPKPDEMPTETEVKARRNA